MHNQPEERKPALTGALLAGILGSLLMYSGDLLLYGDTTLAEITPESVVATMRSLDSIRVIAGGAVGPFAALLYCIGFYGVSRLVRPERQVLRTAVFLLFCLGVIYGGAYHSQFPHLAFAVSENGMGTIAATSDYINLLSLGAFAPWALASILFQYAVMRGRTFCRKRAALLAPLPLALLIIPMMKLPAPFLVLVAGGWYSLMFTVFFAVCLAEARYSGGEALRMGAKE